MSERLQSWLHMKQQEVDLSRLEERMEPELAEDLRARPLHVVRMLRGGLRYRADARTSSAQSV